MQAMKQNGIFTAPGALKFQVGVGENGIWLTPTSQLINGTYAPPAIYGLQILTGQKPFTYRTMDNEQIKKIALIDDDEDARYRADKQGFSHHAVGVHRQHE